MKRKLILIVVGVIIIGLGVSTSGITPSISSVEEIVQINDNTNGIWYKTPARPPLGIREPRFLHPSTFNDKDDTFNIVIDLLNDNIEWNKTFGGRGVEDGFSVCEANDGSYVIIGCTSSFDVGGGDAWLIRLDKNGNELWNKSYGGKRNDGGFAGHQTADGGYILVGGTHSFGAGGGDIWLLKVREPAILLDISGRFGISAVVKNTGSKDLSNVKWTLDIEGILCQKNMWEGPLIYCQ
jgi:hypothetical protein